MAHNLSTTNGKASMMYIESEGAPWHHLGTALSEPVKEWEVLADAAGLGWTADMEPIFTASGLKVPMGQAVVRSDTRDVLGMVGPRWKPVQNRDAFAFLNGVVADDRLAFHTAGALGQGERIWLLAKVPGDIRIKGTDDVTEKYLLLSNSHDGYGSLRVFWTPIRVVCQNTLNRASRTAQREGVTIRHTGDLAAKITEAQRVLGLADRFFDEFAEQANRLAAVKLDSNRVRAYFEAVFPAPEKPEEQKRAAENARETWDALENLFVHGKGQDLPGVRRTLWAAYNAVTEYVDHKPLNEKVALQDAREARLASNWFGNGAQIKGRAFEQAMAFASN